MRAFVFPGQGAQTMGMGYLLFDAYMEAAEVFERANDALGFSISELCFYGPPSELTLTEHAQPAILTVSVAMWKALEANSDIRPDVLAGHSLGEYTALVCAGALELEDAVRLVHKRGKFMQEAVPIGRGAMAAITRVPADQAEQLCRDAVLEGEVLTPANYNAPLQTVVSGHAKSVKRVVELAVERKAGGRLLEVSAPFHCPLMAPAAEKLAEEIRKVTFKAPSVPVVCNVEAEPITDADRIPELLIRQVTESVRWTDCVGKMAEMGTKEFVEIGPGDTLTKLSRYIGVEAELRNFQDAEQVLELHTEREEDKERRVCRRTGKIVWDDGMVWDPEAPGAYGF
jgi:[acyl-carrier-protein] S-malonyltransferase